MKPAKERAKRRKAGRDLLLRPVGLGWLPAYSFGVGSVSVIDTVTNAVTATGPVGFSPFGVAVSLDGSKVYVTNVFANTVSVIETRRTRSAPRSPSGAVPWAWR